MMTLIDTSLEPPDGWMWKHPETGGTIRGNTWDDFRANAIRHYKGNKVPIGSNFNAEIQNGICSRLAAPRFWCHNAPPPAPAEPPKKEIKFEDAMRFLKTLQKILREKLPFASQEEAERRAAICAGCPMNVKVGGCTPCRHVANFVTQLIGKRKTSLDDQLQGCGVCGCELKTAVFTDLGAQQAFTPPAMNAKFPDHCWKKKVTPADPASASPAG